MDKKELLERAKAENVDEGELHAQSQGRFAGFIAFLIVYIFISTFNKFVGAAPNYAVHAMFMAFIAAESYPKLHTAVSSGSWCGGQRQQCGDSGSGLR